MANVTTSKKAYRETLRKLSDRLVLAQTPLRVLDAVKWHDDVREEFFKSQFKKLPNIDAEYYKKRSPLNFDPQKKAEEFFDLERDIQREAGRFSSVSTIMQRICQEYREVVRLLEARGTAAFSEISKNLYGSTEDAFYVNAPRLKDLADLMSSTLVKVKESTVLSERDEKRYNSQEAAEILNERLSRYFNHDDAVAKPCVKVSDDLVADAAAGSEFIKIRSDLMFSERDISMLEVHEGWVHLGTTFNGSQQPICTFLSKGPPSSLSTQEGLAVIVEIFNAASQPSRVQRLTNRILAIDKAEQGANFIDIFNFFREQGLDDLSSYNNTVRVFRGSLPAGGPFTKGIIYSKGFILIYNYIRLAIQHGLASRVPLLFVGKTRLEDQRMIENLVEEGIVIRPRYVPFPFNDLAAVSAWMSYSLFLNKLNLDRVAIDYRDILEG